jgi:RimJ/RimL family protein N-acetyltransferase
LEIKGDRLVLKKLKREDLEFIYEMEKNPLVYYYEADEEPSKEKICKKHNSNLSRMEEYPEEYLVFLIRVNQEDTPIGQVFIQLNWEEMREWEIGYVLYPDYWGKGYATEAVMMLVKYTFENLDAHKIVGFCNANNEKSAKLMERIGMNRDGLLREGRLWHKEWCDEYVYSILEREYFNKIKSILKED